MTPALRSTATLVVLSLLVVIGAVWGWAALTAPFPQREDPPVCVATTLSPGDVLTRDQVVVSVFNASNRTGLASVTMDKLLERGFVAGSTGNAPTRAKATKIYSSNADDPTVRLVQAQFRGAKVVPGEVLGEGVVVVVGQNFKDLSAKGPDSLTVETEVSACLATAPSELGAV